MNASKKGKCHAHKKQAVITLLQKSGKDRTLLENWRPISLVNVDTKIMARGSCRFEWPIIYSAMPLGI